MTLTWPLSPADLRSAFPRDTLTMADEEIFAALEDLEATLRAQFAVSRTDHAADQVLIRAMRRAWPSFVQQTRQVAQETSGTDQYSVTYNRPGVIDFVFPAIVGTILGCVSDGFESSSYTQLTR